LDVPDRESVPHPGDHGSDEHADEAEGEERSPV